MHASFQLTEKEKQLQEERRKLLERKKLEDQDKARIKAQVQCYVFYVLYTFCLRLARELNKQVNLTEH